MNNYPPEPLHRDETPVPAPQVASNRAASTMDEMTTTIRDLVNKVPETINKAVERALNVRDSTVLLRLNENIIEAIDMLVTSGVFKNRAEATTFLVEEGIKTQAPLFAQIQAKLEEIEKLRSELRHSLPPDVK